MEIKMKPASKYLRNRAKGFLRKLSYLLPLIFILPAFKKINNHERLLFEEKRGARSSFCMYSDGKFYDAQASGCTGQLFAWGYWKNINDTILLSYQTGNIFSYDIIKSTDSLNKFQIVKITDCYDRPVRFQYVCYDTTCTNLYNPGMLRILKGSYVSYSAPAFNDNGNYPDYVTSNADTITYKWRCNRECLESISGGELFTNQTENTEKVILGNKRVRRLNE